MQSHGVVDNSRVVSANSSFFRFILSFNVSASRRACWMRDCIASGETSFDMVLGLLLVNQELCSGSDVGGKNNELVFGAQNGRAGSE
jgi:hypothetical protein